MPREERLVEDRRQRMQRRPGEIASQMAVQTAVNPDHEFDDPIGLLRDCHRKIKRSLHVLWVIADSAAGRELTDEEMAAVRSAIDCLRVDGRRHTADEEQSLFPRLRAETVSGDSEEIRALEVNRRQADRLRATVESLYSAWMSAGVLRPDSQLRLQSYTQSLRHLFERHVQDEEQILFPRAQRVLDGQTIAAIGREFRARWS